MQDAKLHCKENIVATISASPLNFGLFGFIVKLFRRASDVDGANIIVNANGDIIHENDWFETILFNDN